MADSSLLDVNHLPHSTEPHHPSPLSRPALHFRLEFKPTHQHTPSTTANPSKCRKRLPQDIVAVSPSKAA